MTDATAGCPSGNWSAAAASGTPWDRTRRRAVPRAPRPRAARRRSCTLAPGTGPLARMPDWNSAPMTIADAALLAGRELRRRARPGRAACTASRRGRRRSGRRQVTRHQPEVVDPGADRPDLARAAQLLERPPAGVGEVARDAASMVGSSKCQRSRSWMYGDVEPRDAEPQPALLDGAHDPVVGVVEGDLVARAAQPRRCRRSPRRSSGGSKPAADLGREGVLVARVVAQPGPGPQLGQAAAVPRRRVEVADAGVPARPRSSPARRRSDTRTKSSPIDAPPNPSSVTSTAVRPSCRRAVTCAMAASPRARPTMGSAPGAAISTQQNCPFTSAPSSLVSRSTRSTALLRRIAAGLLDPGGPCAVGLGLRSHHRDPVVDVAPHVGLHVARMDDVGGDARCPADLDREVPGELVEGHLGRGVGAVERAGRMQRGRRGDVDDAAPARVDHAAEERAGREVRPRSASIGDGLEPRLRVRVADQGDRAEDARPR